MNEFDTAHMCGGIKMLKHNVRTALWLAYQAVRISHTKAKHVKYNAPKWLQLPGSQFPYVLLFQTSKNRKQRNRRAKGCEV